MPATLGPHISRHACHLWAACLAQTPHPTQPSQRAVHGQGGGGAAGGGAGSVVPVLEEMPKWAVLRTLLEVRRPGPTQRRAADYAPGPTPGVPAAAASVARGQCMHA